MFKLYNVSILYKLMIVLPILISIYSCKNKLPDSITGLGENDLVEKSDSIKKLRKIRFLTNWFPNSQFAGYYVGKQKGIYAKFGLDIEMIPYQSTSDSVSEYYKNNNFDFAVIWLSNALEAIDNGIDIANVAQFSQKSSVLFVTRKNKKIKSIKDFNGHKAAIWRDYQIQANLVFKKHQIDVEIIPIVQSLNLFLEKGVDIINVNYFDEYHTLLTSGLDSNELNVFPMADYGINFLEDGLYCKKSFLQNEPRLSYDFYKATLESWQYVFNNKEESLEIVEQYIKINHRPYNKSHQKWMLERYEEMYCKNFRINTLLKEQDLKDNVSIMTSQGMIKKEISYKDFYKPFKN